MVPVRRLGAFALLIALPVLGHGSDAHVIGYAEGGYGGFSRSRRKV